MKKTVLINEKEVSVDLIRFGNTCIEFVLNGHHYRVTNFKKNGPKLDFNFNNMKMQAVITNSNHTQFKHVFVDGVEALGMAKAKIAGQIQGTTTAGSLKSPMPGKVFRVMKKEGDQVALNEPIMILEAMKMEHTIKAHKAGTLTKLNFAEGEQVQGGVLLAEIETRDDV